MKNLLIIMLLALISCGKDEFAVKSITKEVEAASTITTSSSTCTDYHTLKPAVDLLFIWDNSTSTRFMDTETKEALTSLLSTLSSEFNYRALFVPLLSSNTHSTNGEDGSFLVASDPSGLSKSAENLLISPSDVESRLSSMPKMAGASEYGATKIGEVLTYHTSNNTDIFRDGSHLISIIMSNEDQTYLISGKTISTSFNETMTSTTTTYKNICNNTLHSQSCRALSLVNHTSCGTGESSGGFYKEFSSRMYSFTPEARTTSYSDQAGEATPDSFDLCVPEISSLFTGINSTIQQQVIGHSYNYWPIELTTATTPTFDPSKLKVWKITGSTKTVIPQDSANGYTYIGYQTNQQTRSSPAGGTEYTGFFIKLNGTAQATYPECMEVKTETPIKYYGYVYSDHKPQDAEIDTITLTIDGVTVPQADMTSATPQGWEFTECLASFNIRVNSKTDTTAATPEELRSGCFYKLHGEDYIYESGQKFILSFRNGI